MALCLIDAKKLSSLAGMDTECTACSSAAEALGQIQARRWRLAVLALGTGEQDSCWPVLASLKREQPQCFAVVMSCGVHCGFVGKQRPCVFEELPVPVTRQMLI